MPSTLTAAAFVANLHTTFRVFSDESNAVELDLIEVTERPVSPRQMQFSILFRGPADTLLPQRIYRVEHERMGAVGDLFLVPVSRERDGYRYEAVFTLLFPREA